MRPEYAVLPAKPQPDSGGDAHHDKTSGCDYEAALVQCAAGRRSGIASLYANEYNKLRNVARRIVRDLADDVVHDSFVQILKDAKHFDPARGSARAWIYTIVRRTALKKRHNESRELPVGDPTLLSLCEEHTLAEAAPASRALEYDDLRTCLERLDPNRRASLILAIVDGRTHAEIAGLLRVPIGTVKAWIRRELIALRKRLE
jgi:RNA polymerase sigma-70 factor (ECF subfamily)